MTPFFRSADRRPSSRPRPSRHRLGSFVALEDRLAPAVFTVTNLADSGVGSLRAALAVTTPVTVAGPGPQLTEAGPAAMRLFFVAPTGNLTLKNLTLTGGRAIGDSGAVGADGQGGAVLNRGTLTIDRCTLSDNQAIGGSGTDGDGSGRGGAVYNDRGTVTVTGSTFLLNSAQGGTSMGGALFSIAGTA